MKITTLCYIEKDGHYLMMLRNKKEDDPNAGKWVGVGGKFLEDESPDECLLREVYEETGFVLTKYRLRGVVTFVSDRFESELMFLYTATEFEAGTDGKGRDEDKGFMCGKLQECMEGEMHWILKSDVCSLPMWEGDRIFFDLIFSESPFFTLKLEYEGDFLADSTVRIQ